jgi:hypothetical protein
MDSGTAAGHFGNQRRITVSFVSKVLAIIGLVALIGGAGWLLFNRYLVHAMAQRNPTVDIAEAANKIATDPFVKGPALSNVLVISLAIIGLLTILAVIGLTVYVMRARRRYQDSTQRQQQQPYRRPLAHPQIANSQRGVGDALNALVQLEITRYLRGLHGDQAGRPPAMLPPEQPLVVQQWETEPVDELLRDM